MTTLSSLIESFIRVAEQGAPTAPSTSAILGTPLEKPRNISREEWHGSLTLADSVATAHLSLICFREKTLLWIKFDPRVPREAWSETTRGLEVVEMHASPLAFVAPGVKGGELETTTKYRLRPHVVLGLVTGDQGPGVINAFVEWSIGD